METWTLVIFLLVDGSPIARPYEFPEYTRVRYSSEEQCVKAAKIFWWKYDGIYKGDWDCIKTEPERRKEPRN